jgi:hypothetical protein
MPEPRRIASSIMPLATPSTAATSSVASPRGAQICMSRRAIDRAGNHSDAATILGAAGSPRSM